MSCLLLSCRLIDFWLLWVQDRQHFTPEVSIVPLYFTKELYILLQSLCLFDLSIVSVLCILYFTIDSQCFLFQSLYKFLSLFDLDASLFDLLICFVELLLFGCNLVLYFLFLIVQFLDLSGLCNDLYLQVLELSLQRVVFRL